MINAEVTMSIYLSIYPSEAFRYLKVLVEPSNCLAKCILVRKSNMGFLNVSTHSKTMFNTTEQVDLVWLADFCKNFLGLVTL